MSSTEDDEPPPKKARPEAKPAKMVAPPVEWKDFLELEEHKGTHMTFQAILENGR